MVTCIDLFCGAGGLALGFERAGIKHTLLVDNDSDCITTLTRNRPDWNVLCSDIKDISLIGTLPDIIAGGFPCQPFSHAGSRQGLDCTNGTLFHELARCISEAHPKVFIAENVKGLLTHDNGFTFTTILSTFMKLGYYIDYKVLNAVDYEVPQKRERLIFIGVDRGYALAKGVSSNFFPPPIPENSLTLRDALKDCPQSDGFTYTPTKQSIMQLVPPGGNWRSLPIDIQASYLGASINTSGGKTSTARRLSWDKPSPTIMCSPNQKQTERCHPDQTRPLTIRECARIQTFPDNYTFNGSLSSAYRQIGNAVPPNLAYHLGKKLVEILT